MKTVRNRIKVSKEAVKQQPYIMQPLSKSASERIVFDPSLTTDSRYGDHIAPHPASKPFFLWLWPPQQNASLWLPDWRLTFFGGWRLHRGFGEICCGVRSCFLLDWRPYKGHSFFLFCSVLIVPWSQLCSSSFCVSVICSVLNWIINLRLWSATLLL